MGGLWLLGNRVVGCERVVGGDRVVGWERAVGGVRVVSDPKPSVLPPVGKVKNSALSAKCNSVLCKPNADNAIP